MSNRQWNGQTWYNQLDQRRTNEKLFTRFRDHCLTAKLPKHWVITEDEGNPEFSGLFFVSHADSPGEFDIAEFFINSKGKRFWLSARPPVKWAEIETYEYTYEDGTPVYDDY
jgi:hypothetical protein